MSEDVRLNAVILKYLRDIQRTTTLADVLWHARGFEGPSDALRAVMASSAGTSRSQEEANRYGLQLTVGPFLRRLKTLHALGLVRLGFKPLFRSDMHRWVRIAPSFVDIQSQIGFSLSEVGARKSHTLSVTPVFEKLHDISIDVFVIMPFAKELDATYETINDACREFKLKVMRGNEIFATSHVINDIWSSLFWSRAIICDCTGRNPNVFYELGIAHTLGKSVILISNNEDDIPFDLKHWRYLVYSGQHDPIFRARLREALGRIVATDASVRSQRSDGIQERKA